MVKKKPRDVFESSIWWLQLIWKICSSNWITSPGRGENKKYLKPRPSPGIILGKSKVLKQIYLLYWATRSNWGILSPPLWRRFWRGGPLEHRKKNALETNFGEGGVNMPSTSIYSSGWCLFVGADWRLSQLMRDLTSLGGAVTFRYFPRISVSAIGGVAASPSMSFLLTFCTYQNPPHAKKNHRNTSKVTFLVKITLLASSFCWTGYFVLEKMCSHSKHVWK